MRTRKLLSGMAAAAWLALVALSCRTEHRYEGRAAPPGAGRSFDPPTASFFAGPPRKIDTMPNPYEGNVHAIDEGGRLYEWFNCNGCHGAIGGGAIGPPLRDAAWIYGSSAEHVYRSIADGRAQGMPAFGGRIPEDSLWKIVAFVRALGETAASEQEGSVATQEERSPGAQPQEEKRHVAE